MASIGKFFVFMLILTPLFILHGFVIKILWGWFLVPNIGLPPIEVATRSGVSSAFI